VPGASSYAWRAGSRRGKTPARHDAARAATSDDRARDDSAPVRDGATNNNEVTEEDADADITVAHPHAGSASPASARGLVQEVVPTTGTQARHERLPSDRSAESWMDPPIVSSRPASHARQTPSAGATSPARVVYPHHFRCPVCLDLLCRPATLACGHTLCQTCFMGMVSARDGARVSCPICREVVPADPPGVNIGLRDEVMRQFPGAYEERERATAHEIGFGGGLGRWPRDDGEDGVWGGGGGGGGNDVLRAPLRASPDFGGDGGNDLVRGLRDVKMCFRMALVVIVSGLLFSWDPVVTRSWATVPMAAWTPDEAAAWAAEAVNVSAFTDAVIAGEVSAFVRFVSVLASLCQPEFACLAFFQY
jgi:hypothetical protein